MESTHGVGLFICGHLYLEGGGEMLLYRVLVSQTKTKAQLMFFTSLVQLAAYF